MQQRASQRRHRRVGCDEGVCAFEHRLLKQWRQSRDHRHQAGRANAAGAPHAPARLRNHSLGGPPFYLIQNVKRCHVTLNRRISEDEARPPTRRSGPPGASGARSTPVRGRARVSPGRLRRAGREQRGRQNPCAISFRFRAEASARPKRGARARSLGASPPR